jgi:hypothetical protein
LENKNREILREILKDMEDFAELKSIEYPPVYLLGGSGCIIAGYLDRATTDIDLIDTEYSSQVGRVLKLLDNYDFLDLYLTTIPDDFIDRTIKIPEYKNIFVLSREDIILSKIGRFSEIDKEDINTLIKKSDKSLLNVLINKVINRDDLSARVKEKFIINLDEFREVFDV